MRTLTAKNMKNMKRGTVSGLSHHDPSKIEKMASRFEVFANENPASDTKRKELIDKYMQEYFKEFSSSSSWEFGNNF